MGQYKVPQDVEAEDKILGPLTLKQFIYAVIGVAWGGVSYSLFKDVPVVFLIVGVPPALLFLLLGLYRRQDQPFEVYLLAVFQYFGQSRKRLWEKEPIEEVFKVEAPEVKVEIAKRDPSEVIGQLDRLARIVDTRGYSSKQPEVQEPDVDTDIASNDRLVQPTLTTPDATADSDIQMADDMLDFQNNPTAANLDSLIASSTQDVRRAALQKMQSQPSPPTAQPPTPPSTPSIPTQTPVSSSTALDDQSSATNPPTTSKMTANPLADILKSAMQSEELTVSQLAAQASKQSSLAQGQTANLRDQPK